MQTAARTDDLEISRAFLASASRFLTSDFLPKIERCLEKLTDEQIWWRANKESNSIGNLVLHLCGNARQWIICGLGTQADQRNRDSEFEQRDVIPRHELTTLLQSTLAEVRTTLQEVDPATILEHREIQGKDVEILEAVFHVTEHFSMHTGQIILLTKLLTATDLHFYDFEGDVPTQRFVPQSS